MIQSLLFPPFYLIYRDIYGFIFLFTWDPNLLKKLPQTNFAENAPVYFAKQIANNACATQAILSLLLNSEVIDIGERLTEFKSFTSCLTPQVFSFNIYFLASRREYCKLRFY